MEENVWYGHSGDQCPVHPDATVMVVLRIDVGASEFLPPVRAGYMRWTQTGGAGDIVLFKILEVKKEFVVGKWYQFKKDKDWRRVIFVEGNVVWSTLDNEDAYKWGDFELAEEIDWSVAPRDEHP